MNRTLGPVKATGPRQAILESMPFTLSHAAAAWPFRRTRLVFSALIVGCFVPDIPYFLLLRAHGFNGHTLSGLFTFDLPAGLLALWLFHRYLKQASLIYLPAGFRRRLKFVPFSFLPPARLALIAGSILIGAATTFCGTRSRTSFIGRTDTGASSE